MRSDQKEAKRKAWNERAEAWRIKKRAEKIKKLAKALREFFEANKKAKGSPNMKLKNNV